MSDEERSQQPDSQPTTEPSAAESQPAPAEPASEKTAAPAEQPAEPGSEQPAVAAEKSAAPAEKATSVDEKTAADNSAPASAVDAAPAGDADAKPKVKPEGAAKPAPPKPEGAAKPAAAEKPEGAAKPAAAAKPEGATKPAAAEKSEGAAKPATTDKPAAGVKPVAAAKPAAAGAAADGEGKPAAPVKKAPPKKEAPPPNPRTIAAKEIADQIAATISASFGQEVVEETGAAQFKSMVRVRKDRWHDVFAMLKDHESWKFNYIEMMAGTDYKDYIEIVAFVQSTDLGHSVLLKTRTDRENASVPSLVSVHPGVNWEEREIYDLLGVTFTNHPDLRRIMMWEGFKGHPLRKDYTPWEGEEDPDVAE